MTIHKALIPNKLKAVSFVSFLSFQAVFFNKTIKNGQYTTNSLMYFTVKSKKMLHKTFIHIQDNRALYLTSFPSFRP